MEPKKLTDIQVLRAFAIILVLIGHLSLTTTLLSWAPIKIDQPFWLGVELFFIISGYVVSRSVFRGSLNPVSFLIRRAFRLMPAILTFLLLSAVVSLAVAALTEPGSWGHDNLVVGIRQFTINSLAIMGGFLINLKGSDPGFANGAMWSLSVEFQFYYGFTIVLAILTLLRISRDRAFDLVFLGAMLLYVICLMNRFSEVFGVVPSAGPIIGYVTAFRLDFMLLGIIAYMISSKWSRPKGVETWGAHISVWLLLIPIGLAALSEPILTAPQHPVLDGVTMPIMGLMFGALVLLASANAAIPNLGGRVYRTLLWIGDRSYSIYLLHFPVMAGAWLLFANTYPAAFSSGLRYGLLQASVVVPVSFLLADLSYRFVEIPGTRMGSGLAKKAGAFWSVSSASDAGSFTIRAVNRSNEPISEIEQQGTP